MSVDVQNDIERLQAIVVGRIVNDWQFATINVLDEDKGDRIADLIQTLASMTVKGGKKGAAVFVCMPFFDVENMDGPGPRIELTSFIRCIEKPLVNRGPDGTGIHAETMALRIVPLLHNYIIGGLDVTLTASKGDPIMYDNGDREITVTIKTSLQLEQLRKCARVVITRLSATTCTMSCASDDAVIWYTTDGSFPAPTNAAALQVAAPTTVINFADGSLVQAVAYPNNNNKVASDLAALDIP